jgi:hypothetical protein
MASPHHQTARAVVCAAAVLLLSAPAALAGDPAFIASVSDRCTSGQDQRHYALPPQPVPFGATVARLTTAGAGTAWYPPGPAGGADGTPAGAGFNIDVPGPGTYWMRAGSTNAGQAAFGEFHCPGSFQQPLDFQYTVDWFQAPSTPTTYSGSLPARGISEAVFLALGAGQYVARVAV